MNWILRTLVGAVVAGVGLKIGAEIVEGVKKAINEPRGPDGEVAEREHAEDQQGEGLLPGDVVDLVEDPAEDPEDGVGEPTPAPEA